MRNDALMEFSVARTDLLRELKLLSGVVEKKTTIPILSQVLVEASGDRLNFTASDLEISLRCSCRAKVTKPGAGVIPAQILLDYVRLLPEFDIQIKAQDNFWICVGCGPAKAKLAGMSRESFPTLPTSGEALTEIPVGQLVSMIARTGFAISKEESRFTLQGALLVLKGESRSMVATDGHRLAFVKVKAETGPADIDKRVLLPSKAMRHVAKLASEEGPEVLVHLSRDDNTLFFEIGDRVLSCRAVTGNFPDYERVMPKEDLPHSVTLQRAALAAAIDRVSKFSDERSHAVRLNFTRSEIKAYSSVIDFGESEDAISAEYAGPALDVGLNALYLLDFLEAISDEQITLMFTDEKGAFELRPAGEKAEYRYIVMPMRI